MKITRNCIIICRPTKTVISKIFKSVENNHIRWVYLGENVTNAVSVEKWIGHDWKRINIADRLQETAHSSRHPYIDYIGELNVGLPNWWATTISEKNPFISTTFLHICYLKVCKELFETNQLSYLVIFIDNPALGKSIIKNFSNIYKIEYLDNKLFDTINVFKDKIKNSAQKLYYVLINTYYIFIIKYYYKLNKSRYKRIENEPLILLRDWIDYRSFDSGGHYKSAYFGKLNTELESRGKHFVILPYLVNINQKILKQILNSNEPFLIPHVFLNAKNVFSKLFIKPPILKSYPFFDGLDIKYLIQDDFKKDTYRFIDALLYMDLIKNFNDSKISFQSCIYLYENYVDEKIFCKAMKENYPLTKLYGYQHSTVPKMLLPYFFSKKECDDMPHPDMVITNGPYFTDLFREEGYTDEDVVTGSAIRYGYLYDKKNFKYARKNKTINNILVTPTAGINETLELLVYTIQAFGEKENYKVFIKYHPALDVSVLKKYIPQLPLNFQVSDKTVPELLKDADLLIYTITGACLEALYVGVPVLHVKSNYSIDLDMLDYEKNDVYSAKNINEIIKMSDELLHMDDKQLRLKQDLWRKVVEDMFRPVDESIYELLAGIDE